MREKMNAKQTQSIPATPARGGCGGLRICSGMQGVPYFVSEHGSFDFFNKMTQPSERLMRFASILDLECPAADVSW